MVAYMAAFYLGESHFYIKYLPLQLVYRDFHFVDFKHFFSVHIAAPPSSIEIQGYAHNSKVEVRENQDLTLTCIVADAKPAAQIQWYRGNSEYKPDKGKKNFFLSFY